MNILQINNYGYLRGGSDKYFMDLSRLLSENGHSVDFLVSDNKLNQIATKNVVSGFDVSRPRPWDLPSFFYSFEAKNTLKRFSKTFRPDVAHLHIYYGQISASIIPVLEELKVPIVQTLHEYKLICPISSMTRNGLPCTSCSNGSYFWALLNRCNRGSISRSAIIAAEAYLSDFLGANKKISHFIAVSDFVRLRMIEHGMNPKRISTLYNFIGEEAFGEPYGVGSYFLFVGRLETIKGVGTLLRALAQVPGAKLVIAGEGPDRGEFEELAAELALGRVSFVGFKGRAALRKLVSEARCCVAPSECDETFGLVLLESFAMGRPVIASRRGGMSEVVDDGVDGLLFESGDVADLAAKMAWMANHPSEAADMGWAGQRKARERFSEERHLEGLMQIYRKVGAL